MKFRLGFVSNSSSSSFSCSICNDDISGWDISLRENGWINCQHDHYFCEKCQSNFEIHKIDDLDTIKELAKKSERFKKLYEDAVKLANEDEIPPDELDEFILDEVTADYELSAELCPICTFKDFDNMEFVKFYIKKSELSRSDIAKIMEMGCDGDYEKLRKEFLR